jgi:addiction module HigA family antidote
MAPLIPIMRVPTHPGEILREEFLGPLNMSQIELAARTGWPLPLTSAICAGQVPVTQPVPDALTAVFATTPTFWMNLQTAFDLAVARPRVP